FPRVPASPCPRVPVSPSLRVPASPRLPLSASPSLRVPIPHQFNGSCFEVKAGNWGFLLDLFVVEH
ncbi:hypothetical protein, partial [Trichormus variabilis]